LRSPEPIRPVVIASSVASSTLPSAVRPAACCCAAIWRTLSVSHAPVALLPVAPWMSRIERRSASLARLKAIASRWALAFLRTVAGTAVAVVAAGRTADTSSPA
jgi:hypothetical protein